MDSIYNEILEQSEPEVRDFIGVIEGPIVKIEPSHTTLNPLFYTEEDLCGNKECEIRSDWNKDCEFCYNGFCTANKPTKGSLSR